MWALGGDNGSGARPNLRIRSALHKHPPLALQEAMRMSAIAYVFVPTPLGPLGVASTPAGLCQVSLGEAVPANFFAALQRRFPRAQLAEDAAANAEPLRQLGEFFARRRQLFTCPLDPGGTPFQRAVWTAVAAVPFGETRTYGQIATAIGQPQAPRAVGAANGANPLSIVVPCHRLVGHDGKLVKYGGGLPIKAALLRWEKGETDDLVL